VARPAEPPWRAGAAPHAPIVAALWDLVVRRRTNDTFAPLRSLEGGRLPGQRARDVRRPWSLVASLGLPATPTLRAHAQATALLVAGDRRRDAKADDLPGGFAAVAAAGDGGRRTVRRGYFVESPRRAARVAGGDRPAARGAAR
jgi:hypothetical protein